MSSVLVPTGYVELRLTSEYIGSHWDQLDDEAVVLAVPEGTAVPEVKLTHGYIHFWDDLRCLPATTLKLAVEFEKTSWKPLDLSFLEDERTP